MDIKNIFVKESDVYYLWSGFCKKLESLYSAGVVAQRVEAFDVSGLYTQRRFPTRAVSRFCLHTTNLLNGGGVSNLTVPSAKTTNYTETSGDASQWSGYEFIPLGVGVNLFSDLLSYRFLGSAISLNTIL